ncbi:MAG: biopolymer transporter ExbD [Planctomycetia bacterium]|jgi:biopolymer transport protein ExbD|nr:biopolymer transporter ExbD [Planctomycetia bacterium]
MDTTFASSGPDDAPLMPTRRQADDAHFDVTPMVDLVFMMNIFFMVTWVTATLAEVDLPAASHCVAADPDTSVIFTAVAGRGRQATVYLGEVRQGELLANDDLLEERIQQAVEAGKSQGRDTVLIKAEKDICLRDVARLASAAMTVEGMSLKLAVLEKE